MTPGNAADVSATKLPSTFRISATEAVVTDTWFQVIISKGINLASVTTASVTGMSVEIRNIGGSIIAKTSVASPGVPRKHCDFAVSTSTLHLKHYAMHCIH